MSKSSFRRSLTILPIGTVMELTGLTARQIRYYESKQLIHPQRSATNRRRFSLNDVDTLIEIAELIDEGYTLQGIWKKFHRSTLTQSSAPSLTDQDIRRILRDELDFQTRFD